MAVLAAGASRRFGKKDKLAVRFRGKRLGEHVCDNAPLDRIAKSCAVVITANKDHTCRAAWEKAGFQLALNARADDGMGTSVALAALLATRAKADALLIALADMPLVPRTHFEALIAACRNSDDLFASKSGATRMPPAIFGRDRISELTRLTGDSGAKSLINRAKVLDCSLAWLEDIDTPEALRRLS
ncbi:MAG: nucleotidyltransferase family protein [Pseudomonadota bacterium]